MNPSGGHFPRDWKGERREPEPEEAWYVSLGCALVLVGLAAVLLTAPEWGAVIDSWAICK